MPQIVRQLLQSLIHLVENFRPGGGRPLSFLAVDFVGAFAFRSRGGLADAADTFIGRGAVKPCGDRGVDFGGVAGEAKEAFLGGVFGFGDVFEDTQADGVDHVAVGGDEFGEDGGVTGLGVGAEKFEVGGQGGSVVRVREVSAV